MNTRSLVSQVNKSQYTINRSLKNLMQLGLVRYDVKRRGPYELKSWYPDKHILGLMRVIPEEYFKKGFPPKIVERGK